MAEEVGGNVAEFPLSAAKALEALRAAASDSTTLAHIVTGRPEHLWFELVSYNQVVLCLKEGRIDGEIRKDAHGNWCCEVTRLCGGLDVRVKVAIDTDADKVYVLDTKNRL